jgi:hypothetical protein
MYKKSMAASRHRYLGILLMAVGCATPPPPAFPSRQVVLLAFDDGRAEGTIAFPTVHQESMVRFELPPGEHRLLRLWVQAATPGTMRWAFYDQTALEGPGQVLDDGPLVVAPGGREASLQGRWTTVDLSALPARAGVLWLGLKRIDGDPTISACHLDAGQYFLRSDDPITPMNLLPVKRTPLVRLEIAP